MSQEQDIITELIEEVQNGITELQQVICEVYNKELEDEAVVLDSVNSCDELIKSCNMVLQNVEEIKRKFDDEKDILCSEIYKLSWNLPFIERIKCRAKARGLILGEFTIHTIPKEAAPFYGDDEFSCEIIRHIEEERAKLSKE